MLFLSVSVSVSRCLFLIAFHFVVYDIMRSLPRLRCLSLSLSRSLALSLSRVSSAAAYLFLSLFLSSLSRRSFVLSTPFVALALSLSLLSRLLLRVLRIHKRTFTFHSLHALRSLPLSLIFFFYSSYPSLSLFTHPLSSTSVARSFVCICFICFLWCQCQCQFSLSISVNNQSIKPTQSAKPVQFPPSLPPV